uniref:DUF7815 domain-containing protein n=1 Tax=Kalanchoe fedtschenkoi TaxID=63787 RepID=A0A7N0TB56_KALFE
MSLEIPTDVIREVQKQIREQLGLGGYDPDDPSLPSLPAVEDVIAELDPSPAYLRCKRCKGRFLSGVQSLFCVYCGAERHDPEVPPEPIKFKSTIGYRWLLDALKLDGSEIVGQAKEVSGPNKSRASPEKELTVSELMDLEIRWPELPKKVAERATGNQLAQDMSHINLAGLDIENFFPSLKSDAGGTLEKLGSSGQDVSEDVDLFENVVSMEAAGQHNPDASGNDLSGNVSSEMESVFGSQEDLKPTKSIAAPTGPSPSANDWNEDALWSNVNRGVSEQPGQLEGLELQMQDGSKKLDVSSNDNDDWVLGDQWKTGIGKVSQSVKIEGHDYSYDAWNDFTTSSRKPQTYFNDSGELMPLESHATEINLFSSNYLQDEDFGDFTQSDLFSSSVQNSSIKLDRLQSEPTVSDRTYDANIKTKELDGNHTNMNDVETIMSQMHDLSFMLESNLSIPEAMADSGPFH